MFHHTAEDLFVDKVFLVFINCSDQTFHWWKSCLAMGMFLTPSVPGETLTEKMLHNRFVQ